MARIRALKPEAFQSETLSEVSVCAERTFLGLTTQADDRGRLADKPAVLNGAIWPMRQSHTPADLEAELVELCGVGDQGEPLVCRYTGCDGKRYMHLVTWDRHQKVERPSKSRMPRCPHHPTSVTGASEDCSVHGDKPCPPRILPEPSPQPREDVAAPSPTDLGSWIVDRGPEIVDRGPQPPAAAPPPANDGARLTATQRSKRITDAYARAEPMCRWPAVNAIVLKAIKAERWADDEIRDGILRLAAEGRPVTVDTLRVELDGLPARASPRTTTVPSDGLVEHNGMRLKPENVARMNDRARFQAMDAAGLTPLAIEGLS